MCDDFKIAEAPKKTKTHSGKLYGVGLGPGDPELLTLKAKKILTKVDVIFVPKASEKKDSLAQHILERAIPKKLHLEQLLFPMTRNKKILRKSWDEAAKKVIKVVDQDKQVAFVTIGDPFIYSTYSYLLKCVKSKRPEIPVETVPGISAINLAASLMEVPLVEGDENLIILPLPEDLNRLKEIFCKFDTTVLMKIGRRLKCLVTFLKKMGLEDSAFFVSHAGCPNQYIAKGVSCLSKEASGYLSILIVKKTSGFPFRRCISALDCSGQSPHSGNI